MKLAEASIMRSLDADAINNYGIPGIVLMENAGRGTVEAMLKNYGDFCGKKVSIVVGPGNNGGDGFVIARHLHQLGCRPIIFCMVSPAKLKGDAAHNCAIVQKLPIEINIIEGEKGLDKAERYFRSSAVIVDAIFGTGLKREISGNYAEIINLINGSNRPVVAVDISSGLDSDTGRVLGNAVNADLTVTYGLAKPGHFVLPGAELTGNLVVQDIGIPPEVVEKYHIQFEVLEKKYMASTLEKRHAASHKGSFGHLLILAGGQGKTGAAILAAKGALRSGSGLVSLGVPQKLNSIFESCLFEAMTIPLASEFFLGLEDYAAITAALQGKSAVVLGPGIGTEKETVELMVRLNKEVDLPMVIDADGLNCLAEAGIERAESVRIFTPHPGEMARLTGISTKEIQNNRCHAASNFSKKYNVITVLKGAATVIAGPDGKIALNPTGNPGLAAGGSGDVLAGIIGSLVGQGMSAWNAACLGVFVHGHAADLIVKSEKISMGFLASELAEKLPFAFNELGRLSENSLPTAKLRESVQMSRNFP